MQRQFRHDLKSFHETFKVGDRIAGYSAGLIMVITAIGEERFLAKIPGERKERAKKIMSYDARWRKVE